MDGKAYQMFAIFFLVSLPLQNDTLHHYSYNCGLCGTIFDSISPAFLKKQPR